MKKIKISSLKSLVKKDTIKNYYQIIHSKLDFETFNKFKSKLSLLKLKEIKPSIWIESLQDKIENIANTDPDRVVLKQSQYWASAITWVLIGGTAFGVGWISVAKTDEVVISIGKLEPKGGVYDVQMPIEGVAKSILVKEGERVKKGQTLILLDTDVTESKNTALQNNLEINNQIVDKLKFLVTEGAVSEIQYMKQKALIEDIKSEIKVNEVKLNYQKINSPVDGMVFDLQPKGPGYVARASQPVLRIVPLNNLIAKVEIDSRTIGFVKEGKRADISIDSFPASDFGVIEGTITRIGSDALKPVPSEGKGFRFPADIKLDNQYLELKNGNKLPLQAGMSLSANIKLRKVTYIQLLLNKFSDKASSLKAI